MGQERASKAAAVMNSNVAGKPRTKNDMVVEIIGQTVILIITGTIFSFIIWKLKSPKMTYGEFLNKYGEILAYAGLFLILIIVIVLQLL